MLTSVLLKARNANRTQPGLTKGDVEAAIWPRLKGAKAVGLLPNCWDFRLASSDVSRIGVDSARELCAAAVSDVMAREGLDSGDVTIICGVSGALEAGRIKASCERVDGRKLAVRVATARAAGMEVVGHQDPLVVTSVWDGVTLPVCEGLTIGRDPGCDIVVDALGVSRRHGQIINDGVGRLCYIDRSTNGSTVDGVCVRGASVGLRNGSRIGIAPGAFLVISTQDRTIG